MIQRILFILVLFTSMSGFSLGQSSSAYSQIVFKVAPMSFMDQASFQSAQIGFEIRPVFKYSIDFSYGWIFGKETFNNEEGNGFKAKFELRKYIKEVSDIYIALEGFFHKIDYGATDEFESSNSIIYVDDYSIKKKVGGINFKTGIVVVKNDWLFDFYGGVGLRMKNVEHFFRTNPDDTFYSVDLLAVHVRDREGKYSAPNIVLGFKVGYVLKSKKKIIIEEHPN